MIRRSGIAGLLALTVLMTAITAPPAAADYRVKGRAWCQVRDQKFPLGRTLIELWENDAINSHITTFRTEADGTFNKFIDTSALDADDDDEVFLSILAAGSNKVSVVDAWDLAGGPDFVDTGDVDNGSGVANFGNRIWWRDEGDGVPSCALFQGARKASNKYKALTGNALPFNYVIQNDATTFGTPYTPWRTTLWNRNFPDVNYWNWITSYHELAHAVRHHFDGDWNHFFYDAAAYVYAQHHSACKLTNAGFAFNEGFAQWFSGFFKGCGGQDSLSIEDNVARQLAAASKCSSASAVMKAVLRSPNSVHNFGDFKGKLNLTHSECANSLPVVLGPLASQSTAEHEPLDRSVAEQKLQERVTSFQAEVAKLTETAKTAAEDPRRNAACNTRAACRPVGEALALAPVAQARLDQAKLQLSFAEQLLADMRSAAGPQDFARAVVGRRSTAMRQQRELLSKARTNLLNTIKTRGRQSSAFRSANRSLLRRIGKTSKVEGLATTLPALRFSAPSTDSAG